MKYKGQRPGLNIVEVFLPRESGDLRFVCKPVMSYAEFDDIVKVPKPPTRQGKGGEIETLTKDPTYMLQVTQYSSQRAAWLILKSLEDNPDVEWETVDMASPNTWPKWEKELQDSGLSEYEIRRLEAGVYNANCLNESQVEAARRNFQRMMAETQQSTSGPHSGQDSSPSGKPAEQVE